jgi:sortase A
VNRRRALGVALAALTALGLWQVGHGVWIHAKARLAQHLLQRAWARTVAGEAEVRPWPWADTWPAARLRMPGHGADLIVLEGVSGRTLAFGPGRVPDAGRSGPALTTIISGHRDTHFRFLQRVRAGDEIVLERPRRPLERFVVRDRVVVDSRTAVIRRDLAGLALVTCYPFEALTPGGPLRYVVTAEPVSAQVKLAGSP